LFIDEHKFNKNEKYWRKRRRRIERRVDKIKIKVGIYFIYNKYEHLYYALCKSDRLVKCTNKNKLTPF